MCGYISNERDECIQLILIISHLGARGLRVHGNILSRSLGRVSTVWSVKESVMERDEGNVMVWGDVGEASRR